MKNTPLSLYLCGEYEYYFQFSLQHFFKGKNLNKRNPPRRLSGLGFVLQESEPADSTEKLMTRQKN